MKPGARATDMHVCPQFTGPIPHVGGPIIPAAPTPTQAETLQAARLADYAFCVGPQDVVFQGASTVLVGGLPFAGRFDSTAHSGVIMMAASTVMLGGPTFSLPPNFRVRGGAAFQNATIRDLYYLSTLPSGRALMQRLEDSGETITFVPESDPHNSFCSPASDFLARHGIPTGSTVSYNPDVALRAYDSGNNLIDMPPQAVLGHEMVHALNNAEGTHHYGTDPAGPATQPGIEEEESSAIGTGSHSGDYPTENDLRNDMGGGVGRRDNHYGQNTPAPTGNRRPGGY
ncbi:MAG: M91 family zinc metallopeptidase [Polyangiales bacterium]